MTASAQGIQSQISGKPVELRPIALKTGSTGQDATSSGSPTSIAANDFLTLLVTELKNQDPTATTDPNEYVNQLVQVNSLQQLISINETLQNATLVDSGETTTPSAAMKPSTTVANGREASGSRTALVSNADFSATIPGTRTAAMQIATALTSR